MRHKDVYWMELSVKLLSCLPLHIKFVHMKRKWKKAHRPASYSYHTYVSQKHESKVSSLWVLKTKRVEKGKGEKKISWTFQRHTWRTQGVREYFYYKYVAKHACMTPVCKPLEHRVRSEASVDILVNRIVHSLYPCSYYYIVYVLHEA